MIPSRKKKKTDFRPDSLSYFCLNESLKLAGQVYINVKFPLYHGEASF